jgi:hypothetical protein
MARDKKNETAVIEHPVMKSGFRISAPISDIYAIDSSCEGSLGRPWASHVMSIASNVATHGVKRPLDEKSTTPTKPYDRAEEGDPYISPVVMRVCEHGLDGRNSLE